MRTRIELLLSRSQWEVAAWLPNIVSLLRVLANLNGIALGVGGIGSMIIIGEYINDFPNSPAGFDGISALFPIYVFLVAGVTHFVIHGLIAAVNYCIVEFETRYYSAMQHVS
jgi:hypothetical protein